MCYGLVTRIGSPLYVQGVTYIYGCKYQSIAIIHQSFGPDGATVWCNRNTRVKLLDSMPEPMTWTRKEMMSPPTNILVSQDGQAGECSCACSSRIRRPSTI